MTKQQKLICAALGLVGLGFYVGAFVTSWVAAVYALIGCFFCISGNVLYKLWKL